MNIITIFDYANFEIGELKTILAYEREKAQNKTKINFIQRPVSNEGGECKTHKTRKTKRWCSCAGAEPRSPRSPMGSFPRVVEEEKAEDIILEVYRSFE